MKKRSNLLILLLGLVLLLAVGACQSHDNNDVVYDPGDNGDSGPSDDDDATVDDDTTDDDTADDDTADDDTADDDTGDDDTSAPELNLLVIYKWNSTIADDYAFVFADYDINVYSLLESDVATASFSGIDVILVDTDTDWFIASEVNAIADSEIPVIGVFEGGGVLFDGLGLQIGWSPADNIDSGIRSIIVQEPDHDIFNKPYDLGVLEYSTLYVFSVGTRLRYHDLLIPITNVTLLAERPADTGWSALTLEDGKYVYWGLEMQPLLLTTSGVQLLYNTISYLSTVEH